MFIVIRSVRQRFSRRSGGERSKANARLAKKKVRFLLPFRGLRPVPFSVKYRQLFISNYLSCSFTRFKLYLH